MTTTDNQTFLIGNGKTAKVGDVVWIGAPSFFFQSKITGCGAYPIQNKIMVGGEPVGVDDIFLTRREAIDRLLVYLRNDLERHEWGCVYTQAQITQLEAALRD